MVFCLKVALFRVWKFRILVLFMLAGVFIVTNGVKMDQKGLKKSTQVKILQVAFLEKGLRK